MKPRAFTLIEMLLSIAVVAILAGIMVPIFLSFQTRNDVDIASLALVRSIRRAEQLSRNGEGDSAWGVNLLSGEITGFRGGSYADRDATYDEIFFIPSNISFTGTSSMVFSKLYGWPSASSTINLTSVNNEIRTININSKGSVSY
jgi:prepilin-type N-terminal cleavage/methylation domain-containing protein